jgi:hypothetical protein
MEVLNLLQSKNRCLGKFLSCSETFLAQVRTGDLSQLEPFQNQRDSILKALDLYDRKISELIEKLSPQEKTPQFISSVKQIIARDSSLFQSILQIDEQIVTEIEKEKARLTQELSASDKNNQMVKKFKSTWVAESGEMLDGKI